MMMYNLFIPYTVVILIYLIIRVLQPVYHSGDEYIPPTRIKGANYITIKIWPIRLLEFKKDILIIQVFKKQIKCSEYERNMVQS